MRLLYGPLLRPHRRYRAGHARLRQPQRAASPSRTQVALQRTVASCKLEISLPPPSPGRQAVGNGTSRQPPPERPAPCAPQSSWLSSAGTSWERSPRRPVRRPASRGEHSGLDARASHYPGFPTAASAMCEQLIWFDPLAVITQQIHATASTPLSVVAGGRQPAPLVTTPAHEMLRLGCLLAGTSPTPA